MLDTGLGGRQRSHGLSRNCTTLRPHSASDQQARHKSFAVYAATVQAFTVETQQSNVRSVVEHRTGAVAWRTFAMPHDAANAAVKHAADKQHSR